MKWKFDVEHDKFHPLTKYAKKFGVAIKTVGYWCDHYGLPHCQPGSKRFTTDEAFNAWLAERSGKLPQPEDNPEPNKPEQGKQYRLIGGKDTPSIANGNSWAESEVKND